MAAANPSPPPPPPSNRTPTAPPIQIGLQLVAAAAVALAILRAWWPDHLDDTTIKLLLVAVVALVANQVTKFKGMGFEFERAVEAMRQDISDVQSVVGDLEKSVGPGSKEAVRGATPSTAPKVAPVAAAVLDAAPPPVDEDDPNRGQFGGAAEVGGRRLSARIEPVAGPASSACRVTIRVTSTDSARPLSGPVVFHLHPTFGRWAKYSVDARGGVAEDTITSYGAFTVGAEADGGKTRLELNLVDVPGGTRRFYDS